MDMEKVDRIKAKLKRKPARMDELRVHWNRICERLAPHFIAAKLKSFEAHHRLEHARAAFFLAYDDGVPDNALWIYAMHAAGCPAAPHPKTKAQSCRT